MEEANSIIQALDSVKKISPRGGEYWMARDIQGLFGYGASWENFSKVISKAMIVCEGAGTDPKHHFHETMKMIDIGRGAKRERGDYYLTRLGCYLIAMNSESSKPEIAIAQRYFAVQTRRQEVQDQLTDAERRLQLRDRVKSANKSLLSTAKKAGVQRYAIFQDAGYQGLYDMGLSEIKIVKGIDPKEQLLDRAGRTELAANEFRITQTEEKLKRDRIDTENNAINTHRQVGREVRNAIKNIGGTMPEILPAEAPIKELISKNKKELKEGMKKLTN